MKKIAPCTGDSPSTKNEKNEGG